MKRVRRFFQTLYARRGLDAQGVAWVDKHLTSWEGVLFWQMGRVDQRHAVAVSQRAATLARERGISDKGQIRTLVRAGLLHDIGKVRGDMGLVDRVLVVLSHRFVPAKTREWIDRGAADLLAGRLPPAPPPTGRRRRRALRPSWRANVRRAFYTHAAHPSRGAAMAGLWGVEEEVLTLIRRHHQPGGNHQPDGNDTLQDVFAEADGE